MDMDKSVDNDNDYDNINAHNQNSEIESMDLEPIKGSDKGNNVIEINDDNEQMADISTIHSNNIYGVFPNDFHPLVLMRMMVGHRPRNAIKYVFPLLIKITCTMLSLIHI